MIGAVRRLLLFSLRIPAWTSSLDRLHSSSLIVFLIQTLSCSSHQTSAALRAGQSSGLQERGDPGTPGRRPGPGSRSANTMRLPNAFPHPLRVFQNPDFCLLKNEEVWAQEAHIPMATTLCG